MGDFIRTIKKTIEQKINSIVLKQKIVRFSIFCVATTFLASVIVVANKGN
jgi:hypothetical protein